MTNYICKLQAEGKSEEIRNGFNPLGTGKSDAIIAAVDTAILNKRPLDQPVFAGGIDADYQVEEVNNRVLEGRPENRLVFRGRAEANTVVTLFVYSSLPVVVTTRTNANGDFEYVFADALVNGKHDVYVALTNETGKIEKKSRPFSFFVDTALAVDEDSFVAANIEISDRSTRYLYFYVVGGFMAVMAGLALFFATWRRRVKIV